MKAMVTDLGDCLLPGCRLVAGSSINQHHLAAEPKRSERRRAASAIHAALSEMELERQYHSMEELRDHPQLRRFVAWVRRKPSEFWVRTRQGR
jgi:hypothetical protein